LFVCSSRNTGKNHKRGEIVTMKGPIRSFIIALIFIAFAASSAWAWSVAIPHTFQADTTARATDVNDNFSAVKDAVDDNDTRITTNENDIAALSGQLATVDMDSYKPSINLVKIMKRTTYDQIGTINQVFVTISWDGNNEEWDYGVVLTPPSREIINYVPGPDSLLVTHYEVYDVDPQVLLTTIDYDPAIPDIMGSGEKPKGGVWGGATVRTLQNGGMTSYDTQTTIFTILGREDVAVPSGNFSNCVKVFRTRSAGGSTGTSVYWLAEGFGWVKRIDNYTGSYRVYEMTSYTK